MRPVLFDTNAYVAFKRNDLQIKDIAQLAELIILSPVVIAELISGFEHGSKTRKNKEDLQKFIESPRVKIFPISLDTSFFFAKIWNYLKNKGKPIPTNDIWIASQALEHGCVVCTFDKHFSYIDGLISGYNSKDLFL